MSRLVAGIQPVREALRAHGSSVTQIWLAQGRHPQLDGLSRLAETHGVRVEQVVGAELDRLARGAHHQGALASAPELRLRALAELELPPDAVVMVLDEIQDPQNFGAVIRSSVALGAHAIVWAEHASAPLTPATFRASAGAIEHATLCRVPSLVTALGHLRDRGLAIIGLDGAAETELATLDLSGPVALVTGSEGAGLRRSVRKAIDHLARLPMRGPLGSLNASVAAAVALYEVARQR